MEYKKHPVKHFNENNFCISEGILCISPRTYSSQSGLVTKNSFHLHIAVMKNEETKTPMHYQCLQLLEHCSYSQTVKVK
jgi:hypothetical protein